MKGQTISLTQGGAELFSLCQEWKSRMLSHSESGDVVTVGVYWRRWTMPLPIWKPKVLKLFLGGGEELLK